MTGRTRHPRIADERPGAAVSAAEAYGIARYLADAVLSGTITIEDGADALAEWADHDDDVLTRLATCTPRGDSAQDLMRVAAEHHAA
jgi:hypothetical protein